MAILSSKLLHCFIAREMLAGDEKKSIGQFCAILYVGNFRDEFSIFLADFSLQGAGELFSVACDKQGFYYTEVVPKSFRSFALCVL